MSGKILVVDDETEFMEIMCRHLKKWGYDTHGFLEPLKALVFFGKVGGFSVIVLDWDMPNLTGPQLVNKAQEIDSKTQAIIIMAFGENIRNGQNTGQPGWGYFKHLDKPLDQMTDLSDAVQTAIDFRAKVFLGG